MKAPAQTKAKAAAGTARAAPAAKCSLSRQRCACSAPAGLTGECESCNENRLSAPRVHASPRESASPAAPNDRTGQGGADGVGDVLRSAGRPIEPATRARMESHFGHDFGRVRVHADARAADSARALGAAAYTVGDHLAFGAGRYAPDTPAGRLILAHELAHVVQSRASRPTGELKVSKPSEQHEREARQAGASVLAGSRVPPLSPALGATLFRVTDDDLAARAENPHLKVTPVDFGVEDVKEAIYKALIDGLKSAQKGAVKWMRDQKTHLPVSVHGVYDTIVSVLEEVLGVLATVVYAVVGIVVGFVQGIYDMIKGLVNLVYGVIKYFVYFIGGFVDGGYKFEAYHKEIVAAAQNLLPGLKKLVKDWGEKFWDAPTERQSLMIGELTGQILAMIATFGASAAKVGQLPKITALVPVVQRGGAVALAEVSIGTAPLAAAALGGGGGVALSAKVAEEGGGAKKTQPPAEAKEQPAAPKEKPAETKPKPAEPKDKPSAVPKARFPLDETTRSWLEKHGFKYNEQNGIATKGNIAAAKGPTGRWVYTDQTTGKVVVEYKIVKRYAEAPPTEGFFQAHHPVQDHWADTRLGSIPEDQLINPKLNYAKADEPCILLRDKFKDTPHRKITTRQGERKSTIGSRTYPEERAQVIEDLKTAGVPQEVQTEILKAADEYFRRVKNNIKNKALVKAIFGDWV